MGPAAATELTPPTTKGRTGYSLIWLATVFLCLRLVTGSCTIDISYTYPARHQGWGSDFPGTERARGIVCTPEVRQLALHAGGHGRRALLSIPCGFPELCCQG